MMKSPIRALAGDPGVPGLGGLVGPARPRL